MTNRINFIFDSNRRHTRLRRSLRWSDDKNGGDELFCYGYNVFNVQFTKPLLLRLPERDRAADPVGSAARFRTSGAPLLPAAGHVTGVQTIRELISRWVVGRRGEDDRWRGAAGGPRQTARRFRVTDHRNVSMAHISYKLYITHHMFAHTLCCCTYISIVIVCSPIMCFCRLCLRARRARARSRPAAAPPRLHLNVVDSRSLTRHLQPYPPPMSLLSIARDNATYISDTRESRFLNSIQDWHFVYEDTKSLHYFLLIR